MALRIAMCVLASLITSCATPSKSELDAEVRRLCAIDGGVKVYEQVKLASDRFNQYGQVNFYRPTQGEDSLGPEYSVKREVTYYKRGSPEMSRTYYQIIRRADGKLLGETVLYGRGGGDMPGPWHGSSFVCPPYADADSEALLRNVFIPIR